MGLAQDKAEFLKKLENGELRIIGSASAGLNLRPNLSPRPRTPLRLVTASPAEDASPDLIALTNAAMVWSARSTNQDLERAPDIARDKLRAARLFFAFLDKDFLEVTPMDISAWLKWLAADRNLKPRTVYGYCSHLSSFFEWLLNMPELRGFLHFNPVKAAFPRFPEPYQSTGTRSLSDESLRALWRVMEQARRTGAPEAVRDYAIFRFFAASGDRRREILSLRGADIELLRKGLIYYSRKKGGNTVGKTILDGEVRSALIEYLKKSGRREPDVIGRDVPVWLAHDHAAEFRAADGEKGLSSRAFANRMRTFAERAGIYNFHLHQLRHTFARIVAEDTQSLSITQESLGHKNMRTTQIYVQRIEIKSDAHSHRMKARIKSK